MGCLYLNFFTILKYGAKNNRQKGINHLIIRNHNAKLILQPQIILLAVLGMVIISCQHVIEETIPKNAVSTHSSKSSGMNKNNLARDFKFQNSDLTPDTNLHYTGQYCNECHEKSPVRGGDRYLRYGGDYGLLCRCHTPSSGVYIHPFNITPTVEKRKRMPPDFPLENGKLTCLTCHDIYRQCQKRLFERDSLRGAPYPRRMSFCYNCHVKKNYEPNDPHKQLNDNDEIIIGTCLICHKEKPDEKHATFKDVTFIGDIEMICRRCHHIAGNHSGNHDHMKNIPSADGLKRIKLVEAKFQTRLPLDENGKMTCITCHNPHEKRVIPESSLGAKGAGSKYRHRLPGNLCKECHQM
jgi:hypothetical protein